MGGIDDLMRFLVFEVVFWFMGVAEAAHYQMDVGGGRRVCDDSARCEWLHVLLLPDVCMF